MRDSWIERGFAIEPLGETVLVLRFGDRVDAEVNSRVHAAAFALCAAELPGVTDLVPAYASLGLVYEPRAWDQGDKPPWRQLADTVEAVLASPPRRTGRTGSLIEIPVAYGGYEGPDLNFVAQCCGLSSTEVIARHTAQEYTVAMLGFAPGFPYLIGLDPALNTPRRSQPRLRVPRGAVAIGGAQTGIYPSELPGGWHVIGQTPLILFDPDRDPACLIAAGDRVRFLAIDAREYTQSTHGNRS